ncbi:nuclear transport factor 2 family protein [Streptosporangium subroseum]|uniref:nuclear transport factor 2 family protein n=1 Tax=Streptosporangium subroseum TaxID=106412 RepID=UPI00342CF96B
MTATPQEIFERYIWTGMTRDADARAEMFAADGVLETPLVPAGGDFPRLLKGREEIRRGLAAYYRRSANADHKVNMDRSRYVLHTTSDPDVFIAEIDTAFDEAGETTTMSLVQIYRVRDGKIILLRDYFAPELAD